MTKFITTFLKIAGICTAGYGALTLILMLAQGDFFSSIAVGGLYILIGVMLIFLGRSIKRLEKMEDRLGKYLLLPNEHRIPQIKCEKCGRSYDSDVEECPYCVIEKMKRTFWENKGE